MDALETLTVEELDALSITYKTKIEELRTLRRNAKAVRDAKVNVAYVAQRLGLDASTLTKEQVDAALLLIKVMPVDGIVVTPETAHVEVTMGEINE